MLCSLIRNFSAVWNRNSAITVLTFRGCASFASVRVRRWFTARVISWSVRATRHVGWHSWRADASSMWIVVVTTGSTSRGSPSWANSWSITRRFSTTVLHKLPLWRWWPAAFYGFFTISDNLGFISVAHSCIPLVASILRPCEFLTSSCNIFASYIHNI